jgi:oligopeptide transport system ATP-binding protein
METLLSLENLSVYFDTRDGEISAVEDLSLDIRKGEILAVVGESGSGKSQSFLSIMGLLAKNGRTAGRAVFEGTDLLTLSQDELDAYRGNRIAMIFQDPMTALNPSLRLGVQLCEIPMIHLGVSRAEAEQNAVEMLTKVGIPDAASRLRQYPHELSGGMRQRVMIAMALLSKPVLLIADEPTTALDVTIQAQVLEIFKTIQQEFGTSIVLITHDLGVVAEVADRAVVMYAGTVMEQAPFDVLFDRSAHPYTQALLNSTPRPDQKIEDLSPILGRPPTPSERPAGCPFSPRCTQVLDQCAGEKPPVVVPAPDHRVTCHLLPENGGQ